MRWARRRRAGPGAGYFAKPIAARSHDRAHRFLRCRARVGILSLPMVSSELYSGRYAPGKTHGWLQVNLPDVLRSSKRGDVG